MITHDCRFKKSKHDNKDGSKDTVVRENNVIRMYNTNGNKVSEEVFPSNAAARRKMGDA